MSLEDIAKEFGTPVFILCADEFVRRIEMVKNSARYDHLICFSMKSNNNIFLLKEVALSGNGVDVVSAGELFIARHAGIPPNKIVFSGVGKTDEEIIYANKEGILLLNIESISEYEFVRRLSKKQEIRFGISFRVKFDVELGKLHPYLGVGQKDSKFGIAEDVAFELYKDAIKSGLPVRGIHFHLGSQISNMKIFKDAAELCLEFLGELNTKIEFVDVGGGLAIDYRRSEMGDRLEPSFDDIDCSEYTASFDKLAKRGYKIIFELGRYISAPSGVLITRVIRRKDREGEKRFLVVDAGMTELLRIPLYNAYHRVIPVVKKDGNKLKFDVVGPICENSDYIVKDEELPRDIRENDLLCVLDAGAYTTTMLMNYNGRPFSPEVVIKNGKFFLSRPRQSYEDLLKF